MREARRLRRLLDAFGSAEKTLLARADQLAAVEGIPRPLAENIARWQEFADPAAELKKAADLGARVITSRDDEYLPLLREIHDPPIVLYVRGQITERDRNAVAVVGSRKATHYATECAKKLGFQMAYAGLTVVSGLARGIDAGQIFINEYFAGGVETPFGGVKNSGFGREKGLEALKSYFRVKCITTRIDR